MNGRFNKALRFMIISISHRFPKLFVQIWEDVNWQKGKEIYVSSSQSNVLATLIVYKQVFWYLNFANHIGK